MALAFRNQCLLSLRVNSIINKLRLKVKQQR